MSQAKRRLAAIMFTDMVGYTALAQKNEAQALQLLEEHRKLVRPFFPRHNGREVKTMGDSFLVEFASALEAVRCAFDIQQSLHERNTDKPAEESVLLRIGVHLGDVVHNKNDVYGDAVNMASRIEPLALPGGICVSSHVYDLIRNKFEFSLTSLGKKELKNVGEKVEVYRVVLPWERVSEEPSLDSRRIAVMPLLNISPDVKDEYFADGLTEELISTMSRISGLQVISRTSVMGYKKAGKRIHEIGQELRAGSVLEGSVRKADNLVRVTVQLIDANTDGHLWSRNYDRELKNVLTLQSEISKNVAEELKVQLLPREKAVIEKQPIVNPEAYNLYLKGRFYWSERTKDGLNKATKYFERAVSIDPEFALAYSGLADSYNILADYNWMEPREAGRLAKDFSMKALELDDNLAEAHASLGLTFANHFWDFAKAEGELKRAIELRPSYAPAHHWYAVLTMNLRRFDENYSHMKQALELDPHSRVINMGMGISLALVGKTDEAINQFQQVIDLNPDFAVVHGWKSWIHVWVSQYDRAIEESKRAFDLDKSPILESNLAWVYALVGNKEEAERILGHVKSRAEKEYVSPIWIGMVELSLGRSDEGYRLLERGLEERDSQILYFASLPWFEKYRLGPKWEKIEAKIGFA